MQIPVKCLNCGTKWLRVTIQGTQNEATENLQYECPKCSSNWCRLLSDEEIKEAEGK